MESSIYPSFAVSDFYLPWCLNNLSGTPALAVFIAALHVNYEHQTHWGYTSIEPALSSAIKSLNFEYVRDPEILRDSPFLVLVIPTNRYPISFKLIFSSDKKVLPCSSTCQ